MSAPEQVTFGVSFVLNAARGNVSSRSPVPFTVHTPTRVCLPAHARVDSQNDDGCCPAGNDWV